MASGSLLKSDGFWENQSRTFVNELYEPYFIQNKATTKPFVTLTYAQSLDGKISGQEGKPIIISSKASLFLTHRLRYLNDGILIGIGTVLTDNPRLTVRLVSSSDAETKHPRPIILDSKLRFPLDCNLLTNSVKPWILTLPISSGESLIKKKRLESLGAKVFECPEKENLIDVKLAFEMLFTQGIKTIMIEGGSSVISQYLGHAATEKELLDLLVVTISPLLIGSSGFPNIKISNLDKNPISLANENNKVSYKQFGPDIVMAIQY